VELAEMKAMHSPSMMRRHLLRAAIGLWASLVLEAFGF
jgi:hypothetical protein